jgi:hypothetical protein
METDRTYVLGVDPGTTTGLALDLFMGGVPTPFWSDELAWHQAAAEVRRWLKELRALRGQDGCDAVAVGEKFVINAKTHQRGQEYVADATGMLGVLRDAAFLEMVPLERGQQASDVMRLVNDAALRSFGLYAPGRVHVNDAHRHAVALAVKRGLVDSKALLKASLG